MPFDAFIILFSDAMVTLEPYGTKTLIQIKVN